jgi:uncharacterized integral membrane protein (TIGR00698 family)
MAIDRQPRSSDTGATSLWDKTSAEPPRPGRPAAALRWARTVAPGLGLALAIAIAASFLARFVPIVGAAVIAIVIGIVARTAVGLPAPLAPGVRLATKRVLQGSIVLLGTGLSLAQVWTTGATSLAVLLGTLVVGILFMLTLGRALGVDRTLARLIAVGTGICGASAIGAMAPVLEADGAAVAYAISTVFLFNIVAVLLFPPLGHLLHLSQHGFGLWAGTAVNDTSSVVAAGDIYGPAARNTAVVVKLTRTVMIIPITAIFAFIVARERRAGGAETARKGFGQGFPIFILWFLLASALNTVGLFRPLGAGTLPGVGQFLIVVALAAVGLSADVRAMLRTGPRPILMGLAGWVAVAALSLLLQRLTTGL